MDDDLIEPESGSPAGPLLDLAFIHQVMRNAIFMVEDLLEAVIEVVGMNIGEKTEPAEVDAENRNLVVAHLPGGAQNGAVAAEDKRKIGLVMRREVELLT